MMMERVGEARQRLGSGHICLFPRGCAAPTVKDMRLSAVTFLLLALAFLVPCSASAAPAEVTQFPLPVGSEPEGIAAGPDGSLWFAELGSDRIGRISTSGQLTEYPLPTPAARPFQVTAGPDGNVWFTENGSGARSAGSPRTAP
jgi:streptogramin lyase